MATINEMKISDIRERIVAIVKFGPAGFSTDGTHAGEYFQVTIDPQKISPSGEFIRFGATNGDEIVGWQRAAAITIVEVLGSFGCEDTPLLEYGTANLVQMPILTKVEEK
jgi:hypothetical protein